MRIAPGVRYRRLAREKPRFLRIHVLCIDLRKKRLELVVDAGEDPDGKGPAEAVLEPPSVHAERGKFLAGVNANPWRMVPRPPEGERPRYVKGAACDIMGWVVVGGRQHSAPRKNYWSFWVDKEGEAHVGNLERSQPGARLAVAGFKGLVKKGKVLPAPSEARHPRTALGLTRGGRHLLLVIVDGRQRGYSEGVSTLELAQLMVEFNCWNAINMDGGGSSVMVGRGEGEERKILNSPAGTGRPRPVPVMLGVSFAGGGPGPRGQ
jgi:hypothetical protein